MEVCNALKAAKAEEVAAEAYHEETMGDAPEAVGGQLLFCDLAGSEYASTSKVSK